MHLATFCWNQLVGISQLTQNDIHWQLQVKKAIQSWRPVGITFLASSYSYFCTSNSSQCAKLRSILASSWTLLVASRCTVEVTTSASRTSSRKWQEALLFPGAEHTSEWLCSPADHSRYSGFTPTTRGVKSWTLFKRSPISMVEPASA